MRVVGQGLAELLSCPCGRGVLRHIDIQGSPPVVGQDDERRDPAGERGHRGRSRWRRLSRDGLRGTSARSARVTSVGAASAGRSSAQTPRSPASTTLRESSSPESVALWPFPELEVAHRRGPADDRRSDATVGCGSHLKPRRCQAMTVAGRGRSPRPTSDAAKSAGGRRAERTIGPPNSQASDEWYGTPPTAAATPGSQHETAMLARGVVRSRAIWMTQNGPWSKITGSPW